MKPRLILFSGMGGDARLMAPLRLPELEVITPDHVPPQPGESLPAYAARVAKTHSIQKSDILGGASFGGMIASEIAKQQGAAGLILLGSCLNPRLLPPSYRLVVALGGVIPDFFLGFRSWRPLVRWRFAPIHKEAEQCLVSMAADCPSDQLREFGRMIVDWEGIETIPCPALSIHGDRDRVIPLNAAPKSKVFKNAGHAFTLTHAEETIAEIRAFLQVAKPHQEY